MGFSVPDGVSSHAVQNPDKDKRKAYVTFLSGSGDYVKGVLALAKSLQVAGSIYPLVVAVTPDVPAEHRLELTAYNCEIREVHWIRPPNPRKVEFAMAYYVINYSKLGIWEFDDFSRLVYLDSDMICLDNIDELFDLPSGVLGAVKDCFCEATWSHTLQHQLGWCQQDSDEWPWLVSEPRPDPYFNGGMLVFEPSKAVFADMMKKLEEWPVTPFAEQDFLNRYFQSKFLPLPNDYNLVLAMLWRHPKVVNLANVKIAHFCAKGSKPWHFDPTAEHMDMAEVKYLVGRWYQVYQAGSGTCDMAEVKSSKTGTDEMSMEKKKRDYLSS